MKFQEMITLVVVSLLLIPETTAEMCGQGIKSTFCLFGCCPEGCCNANVYVNGKITRISSFVTMAVIGAVFLLVSSILAGAAADTCSLDYNSIYCMFGCCGDGIYVYYCCISNGVGIGVIIGVVVVVLSIIIVCLRIRRRRRYLAIANGHRCYDTISPGYTVTQSTAIHGQSNMGYGQQPPPYPTAPPPQYAAKPSGY